MPEQRITRRDHQKLFSLPTTQLHEFRLSPFRGHLLEVSDVHFNFDSAVFLADTDLQAPIANCTQKYASGLGLLWSALRHAQANPNQKVLVVGHTDTSGSAAYNQPLSSKRASAVFYALTGKRAEWVTVSHGQHKVEDYQRILQWVNYLWGWPCHPGPITNSDNLQTRTALKEFQKSYNLEFEPQIAEDGLLGQQTWGAFFDVYMAVLKDMLLVDDAGLEQLRANLKFVDDAKQFLGCGEHHPIDGPRIDNYKSPINRRVEILFFDPTEVPDLKCHPSATSCKPDVCELYNVRMYQFQPLQEVELPPYPTYQITLQYGQVDKLFPPIANNTHTDPGVRARLQAVGFLYEALNGPNIGPIAQAAFAHFQSVFNKPSAADAVAHLQAMVKPTTLNSATLPAPGEFERMRLPGTWCVTPANMQDFFNNPGGGTQSYRHREEDRIWRANPQLGLFPIEAKVERRRNGRLSKAGAGIKVHFQLIPPDAVPAAFAAPVARSTPVTNSVNNHSTTGAALTFNMTGSPKKYADDERTRNAGAAPDPQAENAHRSVGGKRGNAVAGNDHLVNVWDVGRQHGNFHSGTPALRTAAASSHENAIVVETNDDGLADGILMPSRVGGDRYKVRVFLDPVCTKASKGTEQFAVKAETGTLMVWRILRFSKYLRWDYPPGVNKHRTYGDLPTFDIAGIIAAEYKKSWMDVTVEPQATAPQTLTQDQWRAGIRAAKAAVKALIAAGSITLTQAYNIDALFPEGTNNTNAVQVVLTAAQYDAAIPSFPPRPGGGAWQTAAGDGNYWNNMSILFHKIREEFLHHFTQNALSGVTIFQAPAISSLINDPNAPTSPFGNSGWGEGRRGCWVIFGSIAYTSWMPYDHNANTLHESGHVLYGNHQYTRAEDANNLTGGNYDEHDYHDLCVMGYMRCAADFCGRCMLNHAGWDTRPMPPNNPGP